MKDETTEKFSNTYQSFLKSTLNAELVYVILKSITDESSRKTSVYNSSTLQEYSPQSP